MMSAMALWESWGVDLSIFGNLPSGVEETFYFTVKAGIKDGNMHLNN
jgi:hypothetical protein